ncbi:ATP-dependent DNA helicase pif1-like [Littorina saxatilis]
MLIRNISDQLVNGSLGHVVDLHHDKVVVHFEKTNMTVELSRIAFSVHDPRQKKDIAVRHQFQVVPSFALTIHKAQGLTLERVEIDCEEVFQPGQIGVALGRARSIEGLRVVNFDTRKVLPQPSTVHDYYKVGSAEVNENLTCCRHKRFQTTYAEDTA